MHAHTCLACSHCEILLLILIVDATTAPAPPAAAATPDAVVGDGVGGRLGDRVATAVVGDNGSGGSFEESIMGRVGERQKETQREAERERLNVQDIDLESVQARMHTHTLTYEPREHSNRAAHVYLEGEEVAGGAEGEGRGGVPHVDPYDQVKILQSQLRSDYFIGQILGH